MCARCAVRCLAGYKKASPVISELQEKPFLELIKPKPSDLLLVWQVTTNPQHSTPYQ